ncbi:hypothetical protein GOP47_0027067 [Adiantum capillus-veneris]|nr:hypothetical protein GOP47_0027067 [Adiantum capillus-veneris]
MTTLYSPYACQIGAASTLVEESPKCSDTYFSFRDHAPQFMTENPGLQTEFPTELLHAREPITPLPSMEWFLSILYDCGEAKDLACARHTHTHLCMNGLETLANHVILMFAECGGLQDAQQVFDKFFLSNEYCWSSLIKGHAHYGDLEDALDLLQEMEERGVESNKGMLVALVQACTRLQCVETGLYVHVEVAKEGLERDVFVGSVLVDMYGKCGQISEAQDVFNELSSRDAVAWTALIGGYGEHGLGEEALKCLEEMRLEGMSPDAFTFVCVLKACGSVQVAHGLHSDIIKAGYEGSQFVGSSLVYSYAKCGLLADAKDVLRALPMEGSVAWNALIAGYVEHELVEEALGSYEQLFEESISPSPSTFVCCLKACSIIRFLEKGQELHSEVLKRGYEMVSFVGNSLVYMYGKCGAPTEAQEVFNRLDTQNDVSWNALLTCLVELEFSMEALKLAEIMISKRVHGGVVTVLCSLKACGSMGGLEKGYSLHSKIVRCGYDLQPMVGNALVDMFSKCAALAEAQEVFNTLPFRNVVSWNSLIAGYARQGHGVQAYGCLGSMHLEGAFPDEVSWNSVILGFAEQGEHDKAQEPYARMQEQGFLPNYITYVNALTLCGNNIALESGKRLHTQLSGFCGFPADVGLILMNALIEMYSGCGSLADIQTLFDATSLRNSVTWNALITGYARHGEIDAVLHNVKRMLEAGMKPCEVTFVSVLTACSHLGLGDRAIRYFKLMHRGYGLTASVFHHNCLVDLLVRSGRIEEAAIMLEKLPVMPDPAIWNTMSVAFHKWDSLEISE